MPSRMANSVCRRASLIFLIVVFLSVVVVALCAFSPFSQSQAQDTPAAAPSQEPADANAPEMASRDEPAKLQVNVKLVVARVVVRDAHGNAVGQLKKEDFEIFDKGKSQAISQFDVEQRDAVVHAEPKPEGQAAALEADSAGPAAAPDHFVAYLFDDVHLEFGDLARVREAAERHMTKLRPKDRAAIYTTSGQVELDFTDDRAKLRNTLMRLQPHPISSDIFKNQCPEISFYQADLIVNKHDPDATQVAVLEAQRCDPIDASGVPLGNAAGRVSAISQGIVSAGEHETRVSLTVVGAVIKRISRMPGQRSVVLVSPGFLTPELEYQYNDLIERALASQVVLNTLDARGLYVIIPGGDASHNMPVVPGDMPDGTITGSAPPPSYSKTLMEVTAARANDDVLSALAEGTGGVFIQNNNDFDEGFRRVAEVPEYTYVLGFAPLNLKLDGSFHSLKVKLKNVPKVTVQARRGYFAPKKVTDPDQVAKEEIEDEMFSREELHNLPVTMHTQYFKAGDEAAKLSVLTHVDVRKLRFKRVEGRNDNVLTCVSALFDRNGRFLDGTQKTVTMHWRDETLEHKLEAGITLKASFDVKPGSYVVRLVVRDQQGQLMSAENGAVEIR